MKRQISEINHRGFTAVLTCSSHPEQYDVYYGDMTVGYLRIRDNVFYGQYPDCGGETIYMTYPSEKYSQRSQTSSRRSSQMSICKYPPQTNQQI